MGNEFIQFDWPIYGRPEGGKKGAHACMGGCTCWETVRVCVDNRVHDILPTQVHRRLKIKVLYSKKFSSAKNFVKSDRQAVRQEFIFVKRRVARFVFGRSVRLLIVYLHIHDYF